MPELHSSPCPSIVREGAQWRDFRYEDRYEDPVHTEDR